MQSRGNFLRSCLQVAEAGSKVCNSAPYWDGIWFWCLWVCFWWYSCPRVIDSLSHILFHITSVQHWIAGLDLEGPFLCLLLVSCLGWIDGSPCLSRKSLYYNAQGQLCLLLRKSLRLFTSSIASGSKRSPAVIWGMVKEPHCAEMPGAFKLYYSNPRHATLNKLVEFISPSAETALNFLAKQVWSQLSGFRFFPTQIKSWLRILGSKNPKLVSIY